MSAPQFASQHTRAEASRRKLLALRLEATGEKRLFPWRLSSISALGAKLDRLVDAGASFVNLSQLRAFDESGEDASPRILLAADASLKGLRADILPLLRDRNHPLCLMLETELATARVLDLERNLERGENPQRYELALRGQRSFEDGSLSPERVYAHLLTVRRERERILQRHCSAYFAATDSLSARAEDLLQRCGFDIIFGRGQKARGGLIPSESVRGFRPERWLA